MTQSKTGIVEIDLHDCKCGPCEALKNACLKLKAKVDRYENSEMGVASECHHHAKAAAAEERAAIAAWLRRVGTEGFSEEMTCSEAASFVERGEHGSHLGALPTSIIAENEKLRAFVRKLGKQDYSCCMGSIQTGHHSEYCEWFRLTESFK